MSTTADPSVESVGFIGLGQQGAPMARRIIEGGVATTLWARRRVALDPFEDTGAVFVDTPAELAARSTFVGLCVNTDADVIDVATRSDGVLAGARPGTIIAVHSTVAPSTCRDLADRAKEHGVDVVDSPVSGSVAAAVAGTLLVMVGGDVSLVERCRPIFSLFGDPVLHLGPIGYGQIAKLVNNALLAANMGLAQSALLLGGEMGIDREALEIVLQRGSARSFALDAWLSPHVKDAVQRSATGATLSKDVRNAAAVAAGFGVDMRVLTEAANIALAALGAAPLEP